MSAGAPLGDPGVLFLFDLDGVLVDSRIAFARCVNHALVGCGFEERPPGLLERFIGPPLEGTMAELAGAAPGVVDRLVAAYRSRYRETAVAETTVFPGVVDALDTLALYGALGVVTSKPQETSHMLLEGLGLLSLFEFVVGPALTSAHESKVVTLERALRLSGGATPVALVGDRRFDVEAAHAHGLVSVGVTWGFGGREELEHAGTDHVVETPAELVATLRGLVGAGPGASRLRGSVR